MKLACQLQLCKQGIVLVVNKLPARIIVNFDQIREFIMKIFNKILLAISLLALSNAASAMVITGQIAFAGSTITDTDDIETATVFTFLNPIDVTAATGSFAALDGGTVTYNALDMGSIPASPLWSATVGTVNYSFDLTNVTFDDFVADTFRIIRGNGFFTIGTDTQYGDWSFSTQNPGVDNGTSTEFSFSASQVPEPGVALLLGVGLIGFAVSRKLRKTA